MNKKKSAAGGIKTFLTVLFVGLMVLFGYMLNAKIDRVIDNQMTIISLQASNTKTVLRTEESIKDAAGLIKEFFSWDGQNKKAKP